MQKEKIIRIEFQTTIAIQNIFPCKIIFLFEYNIKITDKKKQNYFEYNPWPNKIDIDIQI